MDVQDIDQWVILYALALDKNFSHSWPVAIE